MDGIHDHYRTARLSNSRPTERDPLGSSTQVLQPPQKDQPLLLSSRPVIPPLTSGSTRTLTQRDSSEANSFRLPRRHAGNRAHHQRHIYALPQRGRNGPRSRSDTGPSLSDTATNQPSGQILSRTDHSKSGA